MRPLQIAVIGTGHLGRIHAKLLGQVSGAELAVVVDPSAAARQRASETFAVPAAECFETVLPQFDAAILASPSDCHFPMAAALLAAGKHLFVEKPLTIDPVQADQLASLAQSRQLTLQVGHVERFNPAWTAVADVTRGAKQVDAVRASRFPGRCLDVGVVMDLMIHDIDLVLSLTDAPLTEVRASGLAVVSDHEDLAEARLEFECGLVANLKASRISPQPARQMQTYGVAGFANIDFGSLQVQTVRPAPSLLSRAFQLAQATDNPMTFADQLFSDFLTTTMVEAAPCNAILEEQRDFVSCILSGRQPIVSGWDGARAVAVAHRVLEQIAQRRWMGQRQPNSQGAHAVAGCPTVQLPAVTGNWPIRRAA